MLKTRGHFWHNGVKIPYTVRQDSILTIGRIPRTTYPFNINFCKSVVRGWSYYEFTLHSGILLNIPTRWEDTAIIEELSKHIPVIFNLSANTYKNSQPKPKATSEAKDDLTGLTKLGLEG